MRLTVTGMVSCIGKRLVRRVRRVRGVRCMCLLLLLLLRRWVFTMMGLEVNGTAFTSDQGITYNMATHVGLELSAVL